MTDLTLLAVASRHPLRTRPEFYGAFTVSLFLHLLAVLLFLLAGVLGYFLSFLVWPWESIIQKQQPKEAPAKQFILISERDDEKLEDPKHAIAKARHSQNAREQEPHRDLQKGAPHREKGTKQLPIVEGRRTRRIQPTAPQIAMPSRPTPRPKEQLQQKPISKHRPLREDKNAAERLEETKEETKKQPKPVLPKPPAPTRRPRVRDLRQSKPSAGEGHMQNIRTSARLTGNRTMQLLKAKWGAYMDLVAKKLRQATRAEESAAQRSFHAGQIQIRFAIAADGSIEKMKILFAPENMVAEKDMGWRAIQNAGPFPPLTDEMQKDPNFQRLTVNFLFH